MSDTSDQAIFLLVLGLRLLVPLAIPRYPLLGIVAALGLDAVDQTVFETFTHLDLTGYQGYDKALDVYYLTIAYLSTLRNWSNLAAFVAGGFLFYDRLVGVMLFELTQTRALLLVFPNTFEYFFIFYELVRLRWDPVRMERRLVVGAAAAIWVVIKLPQEYWIHVAQLDATDVLAAHPGIAVLLAAAVAALVALARWLVTRKLPPADHEPSLAVDARVPEIPISQDATIVERILDRAVLEKIALVSLVCVIFAQIVPDNQMTSLQLSIGISFLIVANTAVSEWLVRLGIGWETALRQFVVMTAINTGLVAVSSFILERRQGVIHAGNTLTFLLLLTLLVTLYDRFRPLFLSRHAARAVPAPAGRLRLAHAGRDAGRSSTRRGTSGRLAPSNRQG